MLMWHVGIDIGGGGGRLRALSPETVIDLDIGLPLQVGPSGSNVVEVTAAAARALENIQPGLEIDAVALGASGVMSLVPHRDVLHQTLADGFLCKRTAVASDALTAHLGALGGEPGAIVVVGTGLIALGTDFQDVWRRIDGWGHLLGDNGSGAWIGLRGLRAGLAALDGRPHASPHLLELVAADLGAPTRWPALFQTSPDRAHRLASIAPVVAQAAREGDTEARRILTKAARHIADALAAAASGGVPPVAAVTGGVMNTDPPLMPMIAERLATRRPDVVLRSPVGTPLDGAVELAARLADGCWRRSVEPLVTIKEVMQ